MKKIITKDATFEFEIKKSKFISLSFLLKHKKNFEFLLNSVKNEHKNATHIVYAVCFSLENCKFSDANEPKGSAGRQIFQILQRKKLINSLIMVIRYLNGGKLGFGLLQNSYKKAAQEVIKLSKIADFTSFYSYKINTKIKNFNFILQLIKKNNCKIIKKQFSETVEIEFECQTKLDKTFGFDFFEIKK